MVFSSHQTLVFLKMGISVNAVMILGNFSDIFLSMFYLVCSVYFKYEVNVYFVFNSRPNGFII